MQMRSMLLMSHMHIPGPLNVTCLLPDGLISVLMTANGLPSGLDVHLRGFLRCRNDIKSIENTCNILWKLVYEYILPQPIFRIKFLSLWPIFFSVHALLIRGYVWWGPLYNDTPFMRLVIDWGLLTY